MATINIGQEKFDTRISLSKHDKWKFWALVYALQVLQAMNSEHLNGSMITQTLLLCVKVYHNYGHGDDNEHIMFQRGMTRAQARAQDISVREALDDLDRAFVDVEIMSGAVRFRHFMKKNE